MGDLFSGLPEVRVIKVDNGYILKIENTGASTLKEPYIKSVLVFNALNDVLSYIHEMMEVG